MKKNSTNLVWIDLEMTGLDASKDVILEIALIITDKHLDILYEGPNIIIHQHDHLLDQMSDWCKQTHHASGLTQAVQKSAITCQQAESEVFNVITQFCVEGENMLCGNSVWQDRIFLNKYMPKIIRYLFYKMIDVTAIQQVIKLWYPNNPLKDFQKKDTHRALDDIKESIEELKYYRTHFFIP